MAFPLGERLRSRSLTSVCGVELLPGGTSDVVGMTGSAVGCSGCSAASSVEDGESELLELLDVSGCSSELGESVVGGDCSWRTTRLNYTVGVGLSVSRVNWFRSDSA